MPDFLHNDAAREDAAAPHQNTSPEPQGTPGDVRAQMLRHRMAVQAQAPVVEDGPPSLIKKPPSRIWTDYYGAVFLLIVALFIAVGTFILRPLVIEYRRLAATVNSMGTLLGDEQGYLQSVEGSISAAQSIPPETLANVDEALPRTADIPQLLQTVSLFAKKENVSLGSVQFTAPPDVGDGGNGEPIAIDINMSVSLTGYAGLRQFLDGVEHSLRVFDLGAITVSAGSIGGDAGSSGETSYSFQIRTYFMPPPASGDSHGV